MNKIFWCIIICFFITGCRAGTQYKEKVKVDEDDNISAFNEFENDETMILNLILQSFEQRNDVNRIILINRYYSSYTSNGDENIRNYLKKENVENELIEAFINGRKNNEIVSIPISTKYEYFDDKTKILNKKINENRSKNISHEEQYVLIKISNICFNEKMDKSIVHLYVEYETFPFKFISTSSSYIIFYKEETWKEIYESAIWEGIS